MKLPPHRFITQQPDLDACCRAWADLGVFAFDTEFIRDETFEPALCLVQVSTGDEVLLIDPTADLLLAPFWALVADPAIVKVVHAGKEDFDVAWRTAGILPRNIFDLQIAAGFVGYGYPMSLLRLVDGLLDRRLAKSHTLTDWLRRPLTVEQVRYAVEDVAHLLALYERLGAELAEAGRVEWAREEFERFEHESMYRLPPVERAVRLKGSSRLDGLGLLVLGRLIEWREGLAKEKNRPVRSLVRDDILVEIARRRPDEPHELEILRGFPMARSRPVVDAILGIIAECRATPRESWPVPVDVPEEGPLDKAVVDLLSSVVQCLCHEQRLSYSLLGSTARLRELLDYHAGKMDARPLLLRGWRDEFIGERIIDLLEGRCAVRLAGWPSDIRMDIVPEGRN